MRALYRFMAVSLALLWVPAMMACALEAVGWDFMCSTPCCGDEADEKAPVATCSVVENGHYVTAAASVKVSPTVVALCTGCICLRAPMEPPTTGAARLLTGESQRPRDWVPVWQFERRAAAPAHAPDSLHV